MASYGLVCEGPTDQDAIDLILSLALINDLYTEVHPLRPLRDASYTSKPPSDSDWTRVLEYCNSSRFQVALQLHDFVVVQIDTDLSELYDVPHVADGRTRTVTELRSAVIQRLCTEIGNELAGAYTAKILFAVCVHSMECWLLPFFCDEKTSKKTTGCLKTLNRELNKKHAFTIDGEHKFDYFAETLQICRKKKLPLANLERNPSLKAFIPDVRAKTTTSPAQ